MPDGAESPTIGGDPADQRARADDSRMIRTVRLRLVVWSGLSTLLVLLVLGASLYVVVGRNLEANGNDLLTKRTAEFARRPIGPSQGFSFGGGTSGTLALIYNDAGQPVDPHAPFIPDNLPIQAGIDAARSAPAGVDT